MGLSFLFGCSHVGFVYVHKFRGVFPLQVISVSNQVMRFNRDDCQTIFFFRKEPRIFFQYPHIRRKKTKLTQGHID